ncbi:MAG: hypothetical protein RLZZ303_3686 [Candidatus Hydrogenedentota bacterium]
MTNTLRWIAFAALALAQLYVPYAMIGMHERVLSEGEQVKIRCQPIDPADLFRGRYVWLSLDLGDARMGEGVSLPTAVRRMPVALKIDEDGFAKWGEVLEQAPDDRPYALANVMPYWSSEGETVYVETPVDRYYMNENAAPEAERLYNEQVRETPQNCYAAVRLLDGVMLIEELYLDGIPMREFVQQNASAE